MAGCSWWWTSMDAHMLGNSWSHGPHPWPWWMHGNSLGHGSLCNGTKPVVSCVAPSNGGHTGQPFGVGSIGGCPPMGWDSPMAHSWVSQFGFLGLCQSNMAVAGPWQCLWTALWDWWLGLSLKKIWDCGIVACHWLTLLHSVSHCGLCYMLHANVAFVGLAPVVFSAMLLV